MDDPGGAAGGEGGGAAPPTSPGPLRPPPKSKRNAKKRRRRCIACGYDLRATGDEGVCPECGASVGHSLHGSLLTMRWPAHLRRLRLGAALVAVGLLGTVTIWLRWSLPRSFITPETVAFATARVESDTVVVSLINEHGAAALVRVTPDETITVSRPGGDDSAVTRVGPDGAVENAGPQTALAEWGANRGSDTVWKGAERRLWRLAFGSDALVYDASNMGVGVNAVTVIAGVCDASVIGVSIQRSNGSLRRVRVRPDGAASVEDYPAGSVRSGYYGGLERPRDPIGFVWLAWVGLTVVVGLLGDVGVWLLATSAPGSTRRARWFTRVIQGMAVVSAALVLAWATLGSSLTWSPNGRLFGGMFVIDIYANVDAAINGCSIVLQSLTMWHVARLSRVLGRPGLAATARAISLLVAPILLATLGWDWLIAELYSWHAQWPTPLGFQTLFAGLLIGSAIVCLRLRIALRPIAPPGAVEPAPSMSAVGGMPSDPP